MLPRPEAHGFTKFVLSIGVFLCVAAFVVPALILRDTDVLLVSDRELTELTPLGESEVRDRQEMARDLGGAAPYFGLLLLAAGLGLIGYGLPRLRQRGDGCTIVFKGPARNVGRRLSLCGTAHAPVAV
jgi:hypothetical protein